MRSAGTIPWSSTCPVRSTRERLERMYPNRYSFSIQKPPEGGAEVRMVIPLRLEYEEDPAYDNEQTSTSGR